MKLSRIAVFLLFMGNYAFSCSTIAIPKSPEKWVLKSYDWHQPHGTIFINPKGLKKRGFHLKDIKRPSWTSKFGSLTFNQHGRELPLGGINEAGLVVEIMWLNESKYGAGKSGEYLNEMQWIQYHLDRFSTVKEVTKSALEIGISSLYAKVHYLVCDTDGECATIDFLSDAKPPVIRTGSELPYWALTNDSYDASVEGAKKYLVFGGTKKGPDVLSQGSIDRFVKGALGSSLYKPDTTTPTQDVMAILKSVGQGDYTKYNIAYDRKANRVYFRTHTRPSTKWVDLSTFNFKCIKAVENGPDTGAKLLNMNLLKEGDVSADFEAYTMAANVKLIEDGLKEVADLLPDGALKKLALYPDSLKCE